jgi:DEAD/DEAH box helicase domain-containing protein
MTKPLPQNMKHLLEKWENDSSINGNISYFSTQPAHPARLASLPAELHPILKDYLSNKRIDHLYTHQHQSWQELAQGKNVVIVTGTASGKTLCYNLPVFQTALNDPTATSLYLFPTKALAQDQKKNIDTFASFWFPDDKLFSGIYDGDTPSSHRTQIRTSARAILTNPDMLHLSILPHHTLWAPFFKNLRYVILDEIHVYRGVFGSHVANVIRRLQRIARFYGANPQFILTSATIANPQDLAVSLIEKPVSVIDQDGAPTGTHHFIIYNPPIIHDLLGIRAGVRQEAIHLVKELFANKIQTILFARSRLQVELIVKELREKYAGSVQKIRGYRSGYLKTERREIEKDLREGNAQVVVSTNALELGIDIGSADAVIMAGYPGSIASTTQQSGRAGRRSGTSAAVLVASSSPLDQFLVAHPEFLTESSPERALVNPDNLLILLNHLKCALFELPFSENENFGNVEAETIQEILELLTASNLAYTSGDKVFWVADQYPSANISLRSASTKTIQLRADSSSQRSLIGEIDEQSAYFLTYPGAIYIHEGQSYLVKDLNTEINEAQLSEAHVDYYTVPQSEVTITEIDKKESATIPGGEKHTGEILVSSQVIGFKKISWTTHQVLEVSQLEMPCQKMQTVAYWLSIDSESVQKLQDDGLWKNSQNNYGPHWPRVRKLVRTRDHFTCQACGRKEDELSHHVHHIVPFRNFVNPQAANQLDNLISLCPACHQRAETSIRMRSGLSGLGYIFHHLAPLFLMCDQNDLGLHIDPESPLSNGNPAIVLYDHIPDGIGLSETIFDIHHTLLKSAKDLIVDCPCDDGCPSCIGPAGEQGVGGKKETLALIRSLLGDRS